MSTFYFLALSLAINLGLFFIAFRRQTDKLTDASYAISFIAIALVGWWASPQTATSTLVALMVCVWALRLGIFLLIRIWRMQRDRRFDGMREHAFQFAKFWISQAVTVWIVLLPLIFLLTSGRQTELGFAVVGTAIWLLGLGIETIADAQKYRFNQQPRNKGKWIRSGLWRYSRHPNYLGEILIWIGIYIFALPALTPLQALVGLASPLAIITLLLFISGIPPLEKQADKKWGSDPSYRAYKKRTSQLLLWPPKKD